MTVDLEQALLDGRLRYVNFFEGRILTGRDLRDEQTAARNGRTDLGRAIGAGVVHGMEVSDVTAAAPGAEPRVEVSAGLALNREGWAMRLDAARTVRLAVVGPEGPRASAGLFDACDDQPATASGPTAEGFHLLTVAPASGYEEEAPSSGLGDDGVGAGCGRRYATLGLRFRLAPFDPAALAGAGTGEEISELDRAEGDAALSRLRAAVAHFALGVETRAGFPIDPFATDAEGASAFAAPGLAARLSAGDPPILSDCETPLAALRLRGGRISYLDMWTARRRATPPAADSRLPLLSGPEEAARREATLFQFQRHLDWIVGRAGPGGVTATEHFRRLPPVGMLPPGLADGFFEEPLGPVEIPPARVTPLILEAMAYPPVDLGADPAPPRFRLYRPAGADWTLFVTGAMPSPEAMAAEIDSLRDYVAAIGDAAEAPGYIVGTVTFVRPAAAFVGGRSEPLAGATLRATPTAGGETVEATTDAAGAYRLSLTPGDWDVRVVLGERVTQRVGRGLTVRRGRETTANFALDVGDLLIA